MPAAGAAGRPRRRPEPHGPGAVGVLADAPHERVGRGLDPPREERAGDAHEEREGDERHEHERLADAEVGEPLVLRVPRLAVEDALHHPEHVPGGEDDTEAGEGHEPGAEAPRAHQDQELADEAVEPGHRDRGQADQQEDGEVPRHDRLQPAELGDEPGVPAVVEEADEEEEGARRDAVVQHLVDGADEPDGRERGDAEHHEAEVRDRRVGDELLEVGLHERDERPVDDPDHGEDADRRRELHRRVREERDGDPQEAVAAHLQQDAGQDHRARRRGLDVRVGEPRVEREHRHLDGERERAGEEEPHLERRGDRGRDELRDRERVEPGRLVEDEERDQHQHAARERVEEELHGGVDAPLVAPDPDEEVHRDEHRLPEHVEEEEVERDEDADHALPRAGA